MRQILIPIRADAKYCWLPNSEINCNKVFYVNGYYACQLFGDELKNNGDSTHGDMLLRCDKCLAADRGEVEES